MKYLVLGIFFVATLAGCSTTPVKRTISSPAVDVTNFKSGLACTNSKPTAGAKGWICQITQDVLLTDQGSCVYNGITEPCTWFGYEFDYSQAKKHSTLQCTAETSEPIDSGNPNEVLAKHISSQQFELNLDGERGHLYNPLYFGFAIRDPDDSLVVVTITCRGEGSVLFQAKYRVHFPIGPK
jgi:hypothetical protein